jgi:hypothetical protein
MDIQKKPRPLPDTVAALYRPEGNTYFREEDVIPDEIAKDPDFRYVDEHPDGRKI